MSTLTCGWPMNETELILTHVRGCRRVDLYAEPSFLSYDQALKVEAMQARRKEGEPLQYILGECEFMGLTLKVGPRVLIPRPETEILVEQALGALKGREDEVLRILDIGTGSGNIAIALAKNLANAQVTTIDVSAEAIEVAKENAKRHGVDGRIEFIQMDMVDFFKTELVPGAGCLVTPAGFDLIVSNPPYVPSDELDYLSLAVRHEPRLALDGGVAGMKFYEAIIPSAQDLLKVSGHLFLEFGDGQRSKLEGIFKHYPRYSAVQFIPDYVGEDRVLCARFLS